MGKMQNRSAQRAARARAFCRATVALAGIAVVSGCGGPSTEPLAISGPTTSSSKIIDLPPGPLGSSTDIVRARLQAAGVTVTAVDRNQGFITARTNDNRFVDCGSIFETTGGQTAEYDGNAARLVLTDPLEPGRILVRLVTAETSAGIGITAGVTNTVVVSQQHRVTIEVRDATGRTVSSETLEFTDRGFARFEDGTVCRSSDAMNAALS